MTTDRSLLELLMPSGAVAERRDRPALIGVDGERLTYGQLARRSRDVASTLRKKGIGRQDRVGMVMLDGVHAAETFLGLSSCCACLPFNPGYTVGEYESLFGDAGVKAVVLSASSPAAPRQAAAILGVPVWESAQASGGAGRELAGSSPYAPSPDGAGAPSDAALVLYTSGTTARPKQVPLTQANLCASAGNVARTLRLTPADRCLNVMPLFHIHGLVAGVLASLDAGGAAICTPGFQAGEFWRWLEALEPSWYTAVPTMHQAILARHREDAGRPTKARLRFLRSSSASLPPEVMARLESAFGAPVIEAYGMTEAAHQIASNPLPPATRKPGSVGVPAGAEVVILTEGGSRPLERGAVGEVAVRGPGVMGGYSDNPAANATAFADGWFRTGDQGYIDTDGYLTLTGRLKELINRGGEKIAPREVEEALLAHEAVEQAAAFAVPDAAYGEQVGAAAVLRSGAVASVDALARHAAGRLAPFKVPQHLVIVDALPKGPTGKLQRRSLAAALGLTGRVADAADRDPVDPAILREIADVWCQVLECGSVPLDEGFISAGGDSLAAARVVNRLRAQFGVAVTVSDFFRAPTVREQAAMVGRALTSPAPTAPAAPGS